MVYKWQFDSQYPVDAGTVGREIEAIIKRDGSCTAKGLLEEARPKDSDLHPLFEWDDRKAAEKWRLRQSRHIIASVRIIDDAAAQQAPTRAFVNISEPSKAEGNYITVSAALRDTSTRATVLAHAKAELLEIEHKYKHLRELSEVFAAIDRLGTGEGTE